MGQVLSHLFMVNHTDFKKTYGKRDKLHWVNSPNSLCVKARLSSSSTSYIELFQVCYLTVTVRIDHVTLAWKVILQVRRLSAYSVRGLERCKHLAAWLKPPNHRLRKSRVSAHTPNSKRAIYQHQERPT